MKKLAVGTFVETKLDKNIYGLIGGYYDGRYKILCANGETWYIDQEEIIIKKEVK
jgi:hypothetical protein